MFVLTQTTTPTVIVNSGGHGTPVIVQIVALLVAPALALLGVVVNNRHAAKQEIEKWQRQVRFEAIQDALAHVGRASELHIALVVGTTASQEKDWDDTVALRRRVFAFIDEARVLQARLTVIHATRLEKA